MTILPMPHNLTEYVTVVTTMANKEIVQVPQDSL